MNETVTDKVGNCVKCQKPANWNSPCIDHNNNLWCDGCSDADRTSVMFRSVKQFTVNGEYVEDGGVKFNGVIVWKDLSCWVEGGSRAVKLTAEEKKSTPIVVCAIVNYEYNIQKLTRCTGCGVKMTKDEIAGYPLFAGVCCASCMKKHEAAVETERKNGQVCTLCGKPYLMCYC